MVVLFSTNDSYMNLAHDQSLGFLNAGDKVVSADEFVYDESRYVRYATNLTNGYYSSRDNIDLWAGPGYPVVLMPIVVLRLPWIAAKLMNSLFLYMAVIYFFYTLRLYIEERAALLSSYIIGLAPPLMRYLPNIMTEVFVIFLVCGFGYHFCRSYNAGANNRVQLLLASLYLAYLALTKVFFGYVILSGILLYLLLYILKRKDSIRNSLLIYSLALFCCLPYLFYTYSLTGKIYYWSNSGGSSLYWMSTPYPDELGDWRSTFEVYENPSLSEHRQFFDEISKLPSIQKDDAFKKRAFDNIINHPMKYLKNWVANVGRLLFHYPYTYRLPRVKIYYFANMIPGMFLFVLAVLCVYPSYVGRKIIPYEIYGLISFGLIAFAGSSLVSAYNRQFQPLMPVFALWIIFTLSRVMKIEIRK